MSSRTPGSNHGGTHDKGGRKLKSEVLVDWLTFSVKNATEPKEVIRQYLGRDPELFQDAGYSLLGYDKVLRFGDICVSMSSNGCREFETMSRLSFEGAQSAPIGTGEASLPPVLALLPFCGPAAGNYFYIVSCFRQTSFLNPAILFQ